MIITSLSIRGPRFSFPLPKSVLPLPFRSPESLTWLPLPPVPHFPYPARLSSLFARPLLSLSCFCNPRNSVWKNVISATQTDANPGGDQLPSVLMREIGKKSDFTCLTDTVTSSLVMHWKRASTFSKFEAKLGARPHCPEICLCIWQANVFVTGFSRTFSETNSDAYCNSFIYNPFYFSYCCNCRPLIADYERCFTIC